jgi:hypothetical protein
MQRQVQLNSLTSLITSTSLPAVDIFISKGRQFPLEELKYLFFRERALKKKKFVYFIYARQLRAHQSDFSLAFKIGSPLLFP